MTLHFDGTYQYKRRLLWFTVGRAREYVVSGSFPLHLSGTESFRK